MKKRFLLLILAAFNVACGSGGSDAAGKGTPNETNDGAPTVHTASTYGVLEDTDITFAEGLAHDETSVSPTAVPLKLDMYYPDTAAGNRPVFMFIHGGGFKGGTKTKPEIVAMAKYYASRGWVFASIDYRTTEELCDSEQMPQCKDKLGGLAKEGVGELVKFYRGIAPGEWIEFLVAQKPGSLKTLQQGIAQYPAQRDAKAALRWIVANASTYKINTDYITVGGASAGAVTTLALGISNPDDFRDEISAGDDPTLSTTNLDASYDIKSMVYFWGSNAKLDLFSNVYKLEQYARYDSADPELFMAHGKGRTQSPPMTRRSRCRVSTRMWGSQQLATIIQAMVASRSRRMGWAMDGKGLSG